MKTVLVVISLFALVTLVAAAPDEPPAAGEGAAPAAPAPAKKPVISVRGTFVPADAVAVIPKPIGYRGQYVVEFAVEPGTLVKKDDVVLRFDTRSIDEAIKDARIEFEHAKAENDMSLKRMELSAASAERDMARKERDYEHALRRQQDYLTWSKPRDAARALLDRKSQDRSWQDAKDELAQLEKMYEEDELVDDTEKIVLERARWNVERRTKYREWWIESRERTDKILTPRSEEEMEYDLANRLASIEKSRAEFAMGEASREISLERMKRAWAKKVRDFERLEYALTTMVIKAPADGILLHGPIEGATEREFKKGTQVNAHAAVVSIATPGDMIVTMQVPAKEVLRLKVGLPVKIKPDAIGADEIETKVAYVSALPRKGNFLVRCDLPEGTPAALLGMGGAVTIELPEAK